MSRTLLTTEDVPKYVKETVSRLRPYPHPYYFRLYGRRQLGAVAEHTKEAEKLVKWAKRYYADARIVERHFYWDEGLSQSQAYRKGFSNYFIIEISDPVCLRFEKDGFYRKK